LSQLSQPDGLPRLMTSDGWPGYGYSGSSGAGVVCGSPESKETLWRGGESTWRLSRPAGNAQTLERVSIVGSKGRDSKPSRKAEQNQHTVPSRGHDREVSSHGKQYVKGYFSAVLGICV
jgi:hypothetical protein